MSRTNRALPLPIRVPRTFRGGFTLIELLVVIVIILVLIGILVPALSSSRNTARRVASQSQLKGISAAIESYATTFNSYPGHFSDDQLVNDIGTDQLSSTENLLLSLSGGISQDPATANRPVTTTFTVTNASGGNENWYYRDQEVGGGLRMKNGRRVDAFYSAKPEEIAAVSTKSGTNAVREFVDTTTGLPILYYRANARGSVPVGPLGGASAGKFHRPLNEEYLEADDVNPLTNGDRSFVQLYKSPDYTNGSLLSSGASSPDDNMAWIVTNSKLSNIASAAGGEANEPDDVVAGKYVLISPGIDGIYFSAQQLGDGTTTTITGYDQLGGFDDVVHIGGQ